MTEYRWFVLPMVEEHAAFDNSPSPESRPKYVDRDGIRGWGGTDCHFDSETFAALPWAGETMFVGRVFGSAEALDALASEPDAYGKREFGLSDEDVAAYLNDRLGAERTFDECVSGFGLS